MCVCVLPQEEHDNVSQGAEQTARQDKPTAGVPANVWHSHRCERRSGLESRSAQGSCALCGGPTGYRNKAAFGSYLIHIHTLQAYTHTLHTLHACIHTLHAYIHENTHVHTYITYIHTHTPARTKYIHAYIQHMHETIHTCTHYEHTHTHIAYIHT